MDDFEHTYCLPSITCPVAVLVVRDITVALCFYNCNMRCPVQVRLQCLYAEENQITALSGCYSDLKKSSISQTNAFICTLDGLRP